MHTTSIFFVAIAALARFALATPPACLIAALGVQTNPADIPALCGKLQDQFYGNITEKCDGSNEVAAISIYSASCLAAGVTITLPTSTSVAATATSTSASASASASESTSTGSGTGSKAGPSNSQASVTSTATGSAASSKPTNAAAGMSAHSSIILGAVVVLSGLANEFLL